MGRRVCVCVCGARCTGVGVASVDEAAWPELRIAATPPAVDERRLGGPILALDLSYPNVVAERILL